MLFLLYLIGIKQSTERVIRIFVLIELIFILCEKIEHNLQYKTKNSR